MDIHDLLARYHNNEPLTPEERRAIEKLIDESGEDTSPLDNVILQGLEDAFDTQDIDTQVYATDATHDVRFRQALQRIQEQTGVPVNPALTKRRPTSIRRWLVAASIILIATVGLYLLIKSPAPEVISFTGPQVLMLPDSSKVILNGTATLSYTSDFGKAFREVTLTGEASFDVHHDTAHKFIVHAGGITTTVLGTAFNINEGASGVVVTVTRGKVQVDDTRHTHTDIVTPNQQISTNATGDTFKKETVVAEEALAWQKDYLIFEKAPMEEVAQRLGERFGVTVVLASPELRNCVLNVNFVQGEDLPYVMSIITALTNGSFQSDGNTLTLTGGCTPIVH